jgi:2-(1,2-epoxy-1,2-dihydrophenyl)acetyl-CoA isomerase
MDEITVERDGGVVSVTLNRPARKNALTGENWLRLGEVFREVAVTPSDRVVVLTGAGGDFCAGADLVDMGRLGMTEMRALGATARAVFELPKPTIAKVDGVAVGAGANLALSCDLVVMSERARFSEIFARRGLSLDFGGSWLLPHRVGMTVAKELALLADLVDAPRAVELGLANRVVPLDELDAFVAAWAARLAAGPPVALSLTKALLAANAGATFAEAVEAEAQAQVVNFGLEDTREAMRAFREKREPTFEGR